jgi:putative membrane protein
MRWINWTSIAFVSVLAIGCNGDARRDAAAKDPAAVGTAGTADRDVTNADKDFVRGMTIANMAEVELGKLVAERSQNPEVKKFGQLMIDDHTAAGEKLKAVAARYNIPVPADLDDDHKDLHGKLKDLHGAEFDREYMKAMVKGHQDVLDKLESRIDKERLAEWKAEMIDRRTGQKASERAEVKQVFAERSDNAVTMSVNQWAAETYPTVHAHLQAAKTIDEAIRRGTTN